MNCRMPKWLTAFAAVAVIAAGAARVQATNLPPGSGPTSFDTVSSLSVGSVQADTGWMSFSSTSAAGTLKGSVRELVVTDSSSSSKLDFVYQVKIDASATDAMGRLTGSSFGGVGTDVWQTAVLKDSGGSQLLDTGSAKSSTADRSANGAVVGFNFSPNAGAGSETYVLVIKTDATNFVSGNISLIDGSTTTLTGFAANPEPTSLVLLGGCLFGLGGAGALRRWRKGAPVVN